MQTELKVFEHEKFGSLRVTDNEGNPWFVAMDVAKALGYVNPSEAIRANCKKVNKITHHSQIGKRQNVPPVNLLIIPESDMLRLVLRSSLPKAVEYEEWVMEDVLPKINRTGKYSINKPLVNMPNFEDPAEMAEEWARQYRQNKALEMEVQQKALALEEAAPKVHFANAVEASDTCILVGQLAKLLKQNGYDTGQTRLFNWLRNNGYLMRQNGNNVPTQYSMELGLMIIREKIERNDVDTVNYNRIFITPMVTGKGQLYFINKLCGTKFKSLPS